MDTFHLMLQYLVYTFAKQSIIHVVYQSSVKQGFHLTLQMYSKKPWNASYRSNRYRLSNCFYIRTIKIDQTIFAIKRFLFNIYHV